MSDKNKQKKQEAPESQGSHNDGWCVVIQKKQNDKENSVLANGGKEVAGSSLTNKNVAVVNKNQKNINLSQDSFSTQDEKVVEKTPSELEKKKMNEINNSTSCNNNNNDTNSVTSKSEEANNQAQITPTDKFNQFRERLNEQTKRYYYFDKQFFKIYNCQQINGLDSNQIIKLKDENAPIFQDLRNIILSYINYNGGIIFFGFNHIKRDNSPHMEVNGFDITKNDKKKYDILHKTLEIIFDRITPNKFKYDLSIMKVRKDKNQDRFTQEKYVARIIVQQGSELRTLYVYKDPNQPATEQITAKYSKKEYKFITIKGPGLAQAQEQKKQLTKVKDLIFTHIDDFLDPQSSYANLKNAKAKQGADAKKNSNEDDNDSQFSDSKSRSDEEISNNNGEDEEDSKSDYSGNSNYSQEIPSDPSQKNGWNDIPDQQSASTKDAPRKREESIPSVSTNKEFQDGLIFNNDMGQWNTELPTDKNLQPKRNKENNQFNNYLDDQVFPQIGSFAKNSSSQIDQGDSQSSSSNHQQEQSLPIYQNGQRMMPDQANLSAGYVIQSHSSSNMHKIIEPKLGDNQNNLLQGSTTSQTPELLNQQQLYLQQQQMIKNMYQQQMIQNQQGQVPQQNPNLMNVYKSPEYLLQQQQQLQQHQLQQQQQQQQQNITQPQVLMPSSQHPSYQAYSPIYFGYPHSQSGTPIPYQNQQQQVINYQNNYDSKLNNSLKQLNSQELTELICHLEVQLKNYQDYLFLAKTEDQKRKFEMQQNQMLQNIHQQQNINQNTLNIHTLNVASNGTNYSSNPHSNSSLAN